MIDFLIYSQNNFLEGFLSKIGNSAIIDVFLKLYEKFHLQSDIDRVANWLNQEKFPNRLIQIFHSPHCDQIDNAAQLISDLIYQSRRLISEYCDYKSDDTSQKDEHSFSPRSFLGSLFSGANSVGGLFGDVTRNRNDPKFCTVFIEFVESSEALETIISSLFLEDNVAARKSRFQNVLLIIRTLLDTDENEKSIQISNKVNRETYNQIILTIIRLVTPRLDALRQMLICSTNSINRTTEDDIEMEDLENLDEKNGEKAVEAQEKGDLPLSYSFSSSGSSPSPSPFGLVRLGICQLLEILLVFVEEQSAILNATKHYSPLPTLTSQTQTSDSNTDSQGEVSDEEKREIANFIDAFLNFNFYSLYLNYYEQFPWNTFLHSSITNSIKALLSSLNVGNKKSDCATQSADKSGKSEEDTQKQLEKENEKQDDLDDEDIEKSAEKAGEAEDDNAMEIQISNDQSELHRELRKRRDRNIIQHFLVNDDVDLLAWLIQFWKTPRTEGSSRNVGYNVFITVLSNQLAKIDESNFVKSILTENWGVDKTTKVFETWKEICDSQLSSVNERNKIEKFDSNTNEITSDNFDYFPFDEEKLQNAKEKSIGPSENANSYFNFQFLNFNNSRFSSTRTAFKNADEDENNAMNSINDIDDLETAAAINSLNEQQDCAGGAGNSVIRCSSNSIIGVEIEQENDEEKEEFKSPSPLRDILDITDEEFEAQPMNMYGENNSSEEEDANDADDNDQDDDYEKNDASAGNAKDFFCAAKKPQMSGSEESSEGNSSSSNTSWFNIDSAIVSRNDAEKVGPGDEDDDDDEFGDFAMARNTKSLEVQTPKSSTGTTSATESSLAARTMPENLCSENWNAIWSLNETFKSYESDEFEQEQQQQEKEKRENDDMISAPVEAHVVAAMPPSSAPPSTAAAKQTAPLSPPSSAASAASNDTKK